MTDFRAFDAALDAVLAWRKAQDTPAPPPSNVIKVTAGQHLQGVIDAAPPGAVLELEQGTYDGTLVCLNVNPIRLRAAIMGPPGRVTATSPTAWLTSANVDGTVICGGTQVSLLGLGIMNSNPDAEIVVIRPGATQTALDQCAVLGDPLKGQRRGIRAEGSGMTITRCLIDEIWRVGVETQGIGASNGCRGLVIDDCMIKAAAQAVMFGGSDSSNADAMPQNVTITRSTLSKNPAWYAKKAQIKNALELKACANFTMSDCILEYAGNVGGQGGYLIVLTPRNQYGNALWSRVENVQIDRIYGRYAGGCLAVLGTDDAFTSGPAKNIRVSNAMFDHIDPTGIWKGDGRAIFLNSAPQDVTLEHWTVLGSNLGASLYGGPFDKPPVRFTMRDVHLPPAFYGMKIDGGGMGLAAWQAWAPDAILDVAAGPGATGYPTL